MHSLFRKILLKARISTEMEMILERVIRFSDLPSVGIKTFSDLFEIHRTQFYSTHPFSFRSWFCRFLFYKSNRGETGPEPNRSTRYFPTDCIYLVPGFLRNDEIHSSLR